MSLHFTIYKVNPGTQERAVLHEQVPAQMADWLCHAAERELSPAEKAHGYKIVRESHGRPVHAEIMDSAPGARRQSRRSREKLLHIKKIA